MPKRGEVQRWRVRYAYPPRQRTRYDVDTDSDVMVDVPEITGRSSFSDDWPAHKLAREVSGAGGRAEVVHVDPVSREETVVRVYEAGECDRGDGD